MSEQQPPTSTVDRAVTAVDRPFEHGVYLLFHDWWALAPQSSIDACHAELLSFAGARELSLAAFHYAQLRFPYHAMRIAVTTAHLAFISPGATTIDAMVDGWIARRGAANAHFTRWEDQLHTPFGELRRRMTITPRALVV